MARRGALAPLFDWAPALAYMALIWWLSSRRVHIDTSYVPGKDKAIHLVEYAVLGGALARATLSTWPHIPVRAGVMAVLATFSWGVLDELHQAFVPGRSPDALDLVADLLGATLGASVFALLWRKLPWLRTSEG